jgi:hypothetical protein
MEAKRQRNELEVETRVQFSQIKAHKRSSLELPGWNNKQPTNTLTPSERGNVWDNAAAESFFSTLNIERVKHKVYRTRDQARADVFDYIERFYNPTRRHSTIGYLSPMQYEEKAMKA